MPHNIYSTIYPYIVPLLPFIGMVRVGGDKDVKFSFGIFIEKMAVPILIAILASWITADRLSYVLEERISNHIRDANSHMSLQEKINTFGTNKDLEAHKEADINRHMALMTQLENMNTMLRK